jgi:DNA-directed RNA polymerase beta subunit
VCRLDDAKCRLMEVSDAYRLHVCDICGLTAIANLKKQQFECRSCHNTVQISQIRIPYACKLLFQEYLMSFGNANFQVDVDEYRAETVYHQVWSDSPLKVV